MIMPTKLLLDTLRKAKEALIVVTFCYFQTVFVAYISSATGL